VLSLLPPTAGWISDRDWVARLDRNWPPAWILTRSLEPGRPPSPGLEERTYGRSRLRPLKMPGVPTRMTVLRVIDPRIVDMLNPIRHRDAGLANLRQIGLRLTRKVPASLPAPSVHAMQDPPRCGSATSFLTDRRSHPMWPGYLALLGWNGGAFDRRQMFELF